MINIVTLLLALRLTLSFLASYSIYLLLVEFIGVCVAIRLMVGLNEKEGWFIFLILVSLVGGLIISFLYIISLCPNILIKNETTLVLLCVCVVFLAPNYNLTGLIFNELNFRKVGYQWMVLFMVVVLLVILFLLDYILYDNEGHIRAL